MQFTCVSHQKPVALAEKDVWIRHQGGGYCDSLQFTAETLTRAQVMGLLLLARGQQVMGGLQQPPS